MANLSVRDFLACCGSSRFADEMVRAGPFCSLSDAVDASRDIWWNKVDIPGWLEAFAAHPRIGDLDALKKEVPTAEWSKGEQSMALKSANDTLMQELAEWNQLYAKRFGFIFLICASGKSSSEILASLKDRYGSRPIDEIQVAAAEQQKITEIRLTKLFTETGLITSLSSERRVSQIAGHFGSVDAQKATSISSNQPRTRPPITTHVLDVSRGKPGDGIEVALDFWNDCCSVGDESGQWVSIGSSITNSDGRSGPLLPISNNVKAGKYKLTFKTGDYFQKLGMTSFYPYVSVVFEIMPSQSSEHFHVPVLLSPFSYTTYRGS